MPGQHPNVTLGPAVGWGGGDHLSFQDQGASQSPTGLRNNTLCSRCREKPQPEEGPERPAATQGQETGPKAGCEAPPATALRSRGRRPRRTLPSRLALLLNPSLSCFCCCFFFVPLLSFSPCLSPLPSLSCVNLPFSLLYFLYFFHLYFPLLPPPLLSSLSLFSFLFFLAFLLFISFFSFPPIFPPVLHCVCSLPALPLHTHTL